MWQCDQGVIGLPTGRLVCAPCQSSETSDLLTAKWPWDGPSEAMRPPRPACTCECGCACEYGSVHECGRARVWTRVSVDACECGRAWVWTRVSVDAVRPPRGVSLMPGSRSPSPGPDEPCEAGARAPVLKTNVTDACSGDIRGHGHVRRSLRPGRRPPVAARGSAGSVVRVPRSFGSWLPPPPPRASLLSVPCAVPGSWLSSPQALAARQRARRLRWARPPSAARLRAVRARMRREARRRAALRWVRAAPCPASRPRHSQHTGGSPAGPEPAPAPECWVTPESAGGARP